MNRQKDTYYSIAIQIFRKLSVSSEYRSFLVDSDDIFPSGMNLLCIKTTATDASVFAPLKEASGEYIYIIHGR